MWEMWERPCQGVSRKMHTEDRKGMNVHIRGRSPSVRLRKMIWARVAVLPCLQQQHSLLEPVIGCSIHCSQSEAENPQTNCARRIQARNRSSVRSRCKFGQVRWSFGKQIWLILCRPNPWPKDLGQRFLPLPGWVLDSGWCAWLPQFSLKARPGELLCVPV